jgi:hypothetical protein
VTKVPVPLSVTLKLGILGISVVKATVPVASGNVIVLSAVNVPANKVASKASAALPSNTTPFDVETVSTLFVVTVPVTVKFPGIKTLGELIVVKPPLADPILILVVDPAAPHVHRFNVFVVALAVAAVPRFNV